MSNNYLELLAGGFKRCDAGESESCLRKLVYLGPLDAAELLTAPLLRHANVIDHD
jgi:hypothetical protein